ncbi:hypothetical protein [Sphingobacterium hungaricum]|uniref:RiboL-PSP-HEPN domain-containing protein n=1 Tax=Sphingobacterium hungaricum TaxID=2082723 RepID=A0A928UX88_9SPHI|nr:hypothetical protein [Sphingobacterium hungaricum]MBE8712442.1 hypothetical protein [Sphingobacterium hungaricum]
MGLVQNLTDFRASITELNQHISFAHQKYSSGSYKHQSKLREFIAESAFLRIYVAWETFVEKCFIDYLINEESINHNRPAKWAMPIDAKHANDIIIGNQKHMDWSNPETVRKISKIFFHQGYVFDSSLSSINSDLMDMKTIRNSAAHISSSTTSKLDGVASRILAISATNYSAYRLLFSIDPRSLSLAKTVLERYLDILDVTAEQIANG